MSRASTKREVAWKSWSSFAIRSAFPNLAVRSPKCPAGRIARHRQDSAGARDRRRSRGAVFHHIRIGFRRDVRRCRRQRVRDMFEQPRRTRPASCSLTKSMQSAGIAAMAWAIPTTSANRRSTSCLSKWTASKPMKASSSLPPRTGRMSLTRHCAQAGSTGRSSCLFPTSTAREDTFGSRKKVPLAPDVNARHRARHPRILGRGSRQSRG